MSDPVLELLQNVHTNLVDREEKLRRLGDQLARTTIARKGVEKTLKALGAKVTAALPAPSGTPSRTGGNQTPGSSPRERFTGRVVDLLRVDGPLTIEQIGHALGRGVDDYLKQVLTSAALKGLLHEDDGAYRVPR